MENTFNEALAKEIINKHNLSNTLLAKWKHRNRIPKKYFPTKKTEEQRAFELVTDKIRTVLSSDKLRIVAIAAQADISRLRLENFLSTVRSRSLDRDEIIRLKKLLSELRIDVKKMISILEKESLSVADESVIKAILNKKVLFIKSTFGDPNLSEKITRSMRGRRDFPLEFKDAILAGLFLLLAEINI